MIRFKNSFNRLLDSLRQVQQIFPVNLTTLVDQFMKVNCRFAYSLDATEGPGRFSHLSIEQNQEIMEIETEALLPFVLVANGYSSHFGLT